MPVDGVASMPGTVSSESTPTARGNDAGRFARFVGTGILIKDFWSQRSSMAELPLCKRVVVGSIPPAGFKRRK